jgi:two-component system sensor histidine kinase KdpD
VAAEALRLAAESEVWCDVIWAGSPREIAEYLHEGDQVQVLAEGRERKRLTRAVDRASASVTPPPPEVLSSVKAALRQEAAHGRHRTAPSTLAADTDRERAESPSYEPQTESVEALAGRQVVTADVSTTWTQEGARTRKRAPLRVYLGAAPGVGKTYAMLGEGQRRGSRGTDVVVGVVETYERPRTIAMLEGLEVFPRRPVTYRGTTFDEMDTEGLIARAPEVALVDELAHTNVPGSHRAKRWEDAFDLLAEGITIITTLNVQHLASVNDVVAKVTGVRQQETVPDWVLDLADDVELVDMSPNALQRRMVHGNIYRDPRKAELALRRFFTTENLTALRELALMRVANQVDESLLARWSGSETPETRERILVCVGRPEMSEALIRRGARIAQRTQGDLIAVHATGAASDREPAWLEASRGLVEELGGEFHLIGADDPVDAVLAFAYQQHVTQIIVGESLRPRWREVVTGSFVNRLIRKASNVDVHVIGRKER